jgi:hypothetical protein
MKKIVFAVFVCTFIPFVFAAQNKKIYVSKQGGEKKWMRLGQTGYNTYYYTNRSENCDSLICRGTGYELCRVSPVMLGENARVETLYFPSFNKAIRAAGKHARKTKKDSGQFKTRCKGRLLLVNYTQADKKGNMNILIEVQ